MDVKFNDIFRRELTREDLTRMKKADLIDLVTLYQKRENILTAALQGSVGLVEQVTEAILAISKRLLMTLDLLFSSSFKSPSRARLEKKQKKKPIKGKELPSKRYPNLSVEDIEVRDESPPKCSCGQDMTETRLSDSSERIEVVPKVYYIKRYNRIVYTCRCCKSSMASAKAPPQIIPGSCYGDSMVKDVVLSKLCDLIPISRYTAMAARQGVEGIPTNSLYEFSRHMAIYLSPAYARHAAQIRAEAILGADETRYRMLEGSEKKSWYLWSFNSDKGILYLTKDSRAGEVAADFLQECACEFLVSDAYRGYATAISKVNKIREESGDTYVRLQSAYCNAHARNNFCASSIKVTKIAKRVVRIYKIIFAAYPTFRTGDGDAFDEARTRLEKAFTLLKKIAEREMPKLSSKSALYDALEYLVTYYPGLTLFLSNRSIPMHNQRSEQSLRNPVVGRKIWYGSHSPDTAADMAKIMSLVESCKLLKVNPRKYIDDAIERVHKGLPALSPYEYLQQQNTS